jgi:hypothetical protein
MYIMAKNTIQNLTATNESVFKIEQTQNNNIRKLFKATNNSTIITFSSNRLNSIVFINCNISYIKVFVNGLPLKEINYLTSGQHLSISDYLIDGQMSKNIMVDLKNNATNDDVFINASISLEVYSQTSTQLFIGLMWAGVFFEYGISTIETRDVFKDYSIEYTSQNGSPLVYSRELRSDKSFKTYSNRVAFNQLLALLQEKRVKNDPFMIVAVAKVDTVLLFTNFKFGYFKEPVIIEDYPFWVLFNIELIEGF